MSSLHLHVSTRVPCGNSSAPVSEVAKTGKNGQKNEAEKRDDQHVQGLLPSDAIMVPVLAGTVLIGLYYLIKWLGDPDILNKILRGYFSIMSLASLGTLLADSLHFLTGFIFPTVWIGKDRKVYHVDSEKRGHWYAKDDSKDRVWDDKNVSPLPGPFSKLKLSDTTNKLLWEIRHLFLEEWTVRLAVHGIINEKGKVKFNDMVGFVLAIGAIYSITPPNLYSFRTSWAMHFRMQASSSCRRPHLLRGARFYMAFFATTS